MYERVWLDISLIRCPRCKKLYVDSSWYVVEMESDVECGICGETFNSRKNLVKRALLEFIVSENGEITKINVNKTP